MGHFRNSLKYVFLIASMMSGASLAAAQPAENVTNMQQNGTTNAVLRTATIYVKDWEASMRFYSGYLGYEVMAELPVTARKSLDTIGVGEDGTARIAYLKPRNEQIQRPFAGNYLALIEVEGPALAGRTYNRDTPVTHAIRGEIVLAHQVVGIDRVYDAMMQDGDVTIVATLGLSGTGQSRSFSAIDPNGIRVEMYEYIRGKEPAENP